MNVWDVEEALKWADTWGPTDGEPPSGDQLALATLARAVRAAGAELASMRQCFEAADRERGELRADAERYRYVLKHVRRIDICGLSISETSVFQLSARIDAARALLEPAADRERSELRASAEDLAVLRDSANDVLALIDKHSKLRDSHAVARLYAALALTAPKNG